MRSGWGVRAYWFPVAALTDTLILDSLKQYKSVFTVLEGRSPKPMCQLGLPLLEAPPDSTAGGCRQPRVPWAQTHPPSLPAFARGLLLVPCAFSAVPRTLGTGSPPESLPLATPAEALVPVRSRSKAQGEPALGSHTPIACNEEDRVRAAGAVGRRWLHPEQSRDETKILLARAESFQRECHLYFLQNKTSTRGPKHCDTVVERPLGSPQMGVPGFGARLHS